MGPSVEEGGDGVGEGLAGGVVEVGLEDDHLTLLGRCISYGADIPYVPIVDLVRSACGIEEADPEPVIDAKLTARVAG